MYVKHAASRNEQPHLAEKSDHCHEEAERYAGYTIRNVVPFAIFPIIIIIREAIHQKNIVQKIAQLRIGKDRIVKKQTQIKTKTMTPIMTCE